MRRLILIALCLGIVARQSPAQKVKPCLVSGRLSYSSASTPQTRPLLLKVGTGPALVVSLVPERNEERGAQALKLRLRTDGSQDAPLKVLVKDDYFRDNDLAYQAADYAKADQNPNAPDQDLETLRVSSLGVTADVHVMKAETKTMPFEFLHLELNVCVHRATPIAKHEKAR